MEKKLCADYTPAELIIGHRWYIKYYQLDKKSGKIERFRPTFSLNRIKSRKERRKKAGILIKWLNNVILPFGYTHLNYPKTDKEMLTVKVALWKTLEIKENEWSSGTYNAHKTVVNNLCRFLELKKCEDLKLKLWHNANCRAFMKWYLESKNAANVSYNNTLNKLISLFNIMIAEKWIEDNPFTSIKKKAVWEKRRREFTLEERRVVYTAVKKRDPLLFLALCLVYYSLIRPAEARRLKKRFINLKTGQITLPAPITKHRKKTQYATLPKAVLQYFREYLEGVPSSHFIFGSGWSPAEKMAGKNEMNRRHGLILEDLQRRGRVGNISGLSFYSWKDTSVKRYIKEAGMGAMELKEAGRWLRLESITHYYEDEKFIEAVSEMQEG